MSVNTEIIARHRRPVDRVAVVILTWNQRQTTLRCLRSLADIGCRLDSVVVWDNGSTDGSEAAIAREYPTVIIRRSPTNLGVASGRNAAARLAVEKLDPAYLLFVDNDMRFTPGFIEALVAPFAGDEKLAQTTAKIVTLDESGRIHAAGGSRVSFPLGTIEPVGYLEMDSGQYDVTRKCLPGGGGTMVRSAVFFGLSGFDPVFDPYGPEDLDFSYRVIEAGYYGRYVPEAVVYHDHRRSVNDGKFDEVYAGNKMRHWMILLDRHATTTQKILFYCIGAPMGAARIAIRELSRRNPGAIKGILGSLWRQITRRPSR